MIHNAEINNRRVTVNSPRFVQGGINSDTIVVNYDEEWAECDTILCTFDNESLEKPETYLYSPSQELFVPKSVLEKVGILRISFTGYIDGNIRLTTQIMHVNPCRVVPSGVIAGEGEDSHPDQLDYLGQLIKEVEDLKEDIQSGVFDYNNAINKPSIGGIQLVGDKTFEELGLSSIAKEDIDMIAV